MSDSLFMFSPGALAAIQDCECRFSKMVDDIKFTQSEIDDDNYNVTISAHPLGVCSVCGKPYKLLVDTRKVAVVTNIGEE